MGQAGTPWQKEWGHGLVIAGRREAGVPLPHSHHIPPARHPEDQAAPSIQQEADVRVCRADMAHGKHHSPLPTHPGTAIRTS